MQLWTGFNRLLQQWRVYFETQITDGTLLLQCSSGLEILILRKYDQKPSVIDY